MFRIHPIGGGKRALKKKDGRMIELMAGVEDGGWRAETD